MTCAPVRSIGRGAHQALRGDPAPQKAELVRQGGDAGPHRCQGSSLAGALGSLRTLSGHAMPRWMGRRGSRAHMSLKPSVLPCLNPN
eukprot:5367265-Pyramimonas_sp.AAC.1